ncbi:HAD-IA family hydrolase [Kitasatospora purpeofusca]|uniref:HAD-IA family hydrolase n=1 Tax=Kitasatospora purpeofusca TaxID=67352 RepID=UPI003820DE39
MTATAEPPPSGSYFLAPPGRTRPPRNPIPARQRPWRAQQNGPTGMHTRALLFDVNGVLRHFDNSGAALGEEAAGLEPGTIARYAYDHPSYTEAKVGLMTDQEWADGVELRLAKDFGATAAAAAIAPWRADRGRHDTVMIDLIGQIRATGMPCAVLSNFTDALHNDLDLHGITVDHAFASADLRVTKPSPLAFEAAADRLGLHPSEVYFFDDQLGFVAGARAAGMRAELFTGAHALADRLATLGIPVQVPATV